MSLRSDRHAYDPLIEAMRATGFHDQDRLNAALDAASQHLPPGDRPHYAKAPIAAARELAADGNWVGAWKKVHQALCGLTWASPPDPRSPGCPPMPGPEPFTGERNTCPSCSASLPEQANFCTMCGRRLGDG